MHLKQLNGLNRPGSNRPRNENRASPAYKPETPEHSFQPISESSKAETSLFQEKDLFEERTLIFILLTIAWFVISRHEWIFFKS